MFVKNQDDMLMAARMLMRGIAARPLVASTSSTCCMDSRSCSASSSHLKGFVRLPDLSSSSSSSARSCATLSSSSSTTTGSPAAAMDDGRAQRKGGTTTRSRLAAMVVAEEEAAGSPPPITDALSRALSLGNMSSAERTRARLAEIREQHARHETDTGSAEVQVAALTDRIARLTVHLRSNRGDKHSLRGLQLMLAARKKHLKYLRRTDTARYHRIIDALGLKAQAFSQPRYKF